MGDNETFIAATRRDDRTEYDDRQGRACAAAWPGGLEVAAPGTVQILSLTRQVLTNAQSTFESRINLHINLEQYIFLKTSIVVTAVSSQHGTGPHQPPGRWPRWPAQEPDGSARGCRQIKW